MILGCIADDSTGASDLANTLAKAGMATTQFVGVPRDVAPADCDARVVALKTRSIEPAAAVSLLLDALNWPKAQDCRQCLLKYCSTFDSAPAGNIGPVAEALLDALGAPVAVVCPVFPATGRTLFIGHLFVKERQLSESGMKKHPLTAAIDQSVAYCVAFGAIAIHAMAGVVPPERSEEGKAVFTRNLKLAAAKASAHGLTLLLEPLNHHDAPGYFYSSIGAAEQMIKAVGAANIKIMFDVYHVGVSQRDVLKRLERYLPVIGHVQIAAVPSCAEPDEGETAYRAIFDALDILGYAGWVGCEYKPGASTDDGLRWAEALGVRL
jgi:hydroxypyruvate isomerase